MSDRIAELAARIDAANYELLVLIREFDATRAWSGFTSCASWLSWRAGLAPGPAREHVRVAHALGKLPKLSEAMRRGRVSYSKVRAVTRVATPETEQALLDVALAGTAAHVERVVRAWRRTDRAAERDEHRRQQANRALHTWVDDDGMVIIRGRLTPEVGSVFRRALEAAVEADRGAADAGGAGAAGGADRDAADASGAGAAGGVDRGAADASGAGAAGGADRGAAGAGGANAVDAVDESVGVERSLGQRRADALGRLAECALAGGLDRGTAGDRYQVVLHVDAEALEDETLHVDAETLEDETLHVDTETLKEDAEPPEEDAAASSADDGGDAVGVPAGTSGRAGAPSRAMAKGENAGSENAKGENAGSENAKGENAGSENGAHAAAGDSDGGGVPAGTPGRGHRVAAGCPGRADGRRQATLADGRRQAVLAEDGGIRVGQETARRIACDAATVTMRHGPDGGVLDVGRRTRTISPALRRALAARDGQCRFPGCSARRCDAHHVRHWADGGETALSNLVLLCRRHHRAVHEDGFRVRVAAGGTVTFVRPDGRPLPEAPGAPAWEGSALAPVDGRLRAAGIDIDAQTAPRWQGERLDLGWAIDVLWRPRTAGDSAGGVPAGTPGP